MDSRSGQEFRSRSAAALRSGQGPVAERRPSVQHFMVRDGGDYAAGLGERGFGFADDTLVLPTGATTHLDALAHVWADHQMWNGFSASEVTSRGAARCGIDKAGPIVTRALFVDAGPPDGTSSSDDHKLTADDLQRALDRVTPAPGDALVRTGWLARWRAGTATAERWAGLDPSCAAWIDEQGFALVGADNVAVEAGPPRSGRCRADARRADPGPGRPPPGAHGSRGAGDHRPHRVPARRGSAPPRRRGRQPGEPGGRPVTAPSALSSVSVCEAWARDGIQGWPETLTTGDKLRVITAAAASGSARSTPRPSFRSRSCPSSPTPNRCSPASRSRSASASSP